MLTLRINYKDGGFDVISRKASETSFYDLDRVVGEVEDVVLSIEILGYEP